MEDFSRAFSFGNWQSEIGNSFLWHLALFPLIIFPVASNGFDLPIPLGQALCRVADADFREGNLHYARGEFNSAAAAYRRAIQLAPRFVDAHSNLGNALSAQGKIPEAIRAYEQAISFKPDCSQAHWNLALALLAQGDFDRGWQEYEWRHHDPSTPKCPGVQWKGEPLHGKTILLIAEQGFGDAIQFIRFVPMVAARGGKIVLVCQPELCRLFSAMRGISAIVPFSEPLPKVDVYCHLMSLPAIFGIRLDSIPVEIPYLHAGPTLVQKWGQLLGPRNENFRVGLAWAGRSAHQYDRCRSISLAELAPLAKLRQVEFHSLQIGPSARQALEQRQGMIVHDHAGQLTDLIETAALIANLDLVISVDTAIPHLAGALRARVWLMLPYAADWRWLLNREDSPWYPTARLFRQARPGDWAGVIEAIRHQGNRMWSQKCEEPPRFASGWSSRK